MALEKPVTCVLRNITDQPGGDKALPADASTPGVGPSRANSILRQATNAHPGSAGWLGLHLFKETQMNSFTFRLRTQFRWLRHPLLVVMALLAARNLGNGTWKVPTQPLSSWRQGGDTDVTANCYSFALGETHEALPPGHLAINKKRDYRTGQKTSNEPAHVLALIEMDGLVPLRRKDQLHGDAYPVAVFGNFKRNRFHLVRPGPDGSWYHKPGQGHARAKRGFPTWCFGYSFLGMYMVDLNRVYSLQTVDLTRFAEEQAFDLGLT